MFVDLLGKLGRFARYARLGGRNREEFSRMHCCHASVPHVQVRRVFGLSNGSNLRRDTRRTFLLSKSTFRNQIDYPSYSPRPASPYPPPNPHIPNLSSPLPLPPFHTQHSSIYPLANSCSPASAPLKISESPPYVYESAFCQIVWYGQPPGMVPTAVL